MANNNETYRREGSLAQYRKLLCEYADSIATHTVHAIAGKRAAAARMLAEDTDMAFPAKGSDGYEYTDIDAMFAPDLGVNIMRLPVTADIEPMFRCGLPTVTHLLGITVNDTFRPTDRLLRLLPEGVKVTSFSTAGAEEQAIIRKYYGHVADVTPLRPATVLNTAFAQDGILIYVKRGVKSERPIQLVNILKALEGPDGQEMPVLAVRRLLVVVEPFAEATLLVCDHDIASTVSSTSTRITEMVIGEGAHLNYYELEETSDTTSRYTRTAVRMDRDSKADIFSGTLKPGRTRNDIEVHLDAPGAELRIDGAVIVSKDQVGDNNAVVYHHAGHCISNQNFKYLVRDNGRGAFEGLIRVDQGAVQTEAYQNDKNIMGDKGARMHARPQLEIYCDDVKCSHGAATGQLDENALFYMRSRGIDVEEARAMLMNAFMSDVIDRISLMPLRDRLRHIIEKRLSGHIAHCNDCPLD